MRQHSTSALLHPDSVLAAQNAKNILSSASCAAGACTLNSGTLNSGTTVAVEGADQALWANHGSGYVGLGGTLLAAPAVVTLPSGGHLYIVTGADHQLWVRSDTLGWQLLGQSYCVDNPASYLSGNVLTVACQGSDHALWYATITLPAGGLPTASGFASLGGITQFGPAIAPIAGTLSFLVIGTDNQIWYRNPSGSWQAISAWCTGHPAAA